MISGVELLDTCLRGASLGQLLLVMISVLRTRPLSVSSGLLVAACPCVGAYLLLTASVDEVYWSWRPVLLVLSHAMPYLLWALGAEVFRSAVRPTRWPKPVFVLVGLLLAVHLLSFGVREGEDWFHDASHILYLLLFVHLAWLSVAGMADDLVSARRRARALLFVFISLHFLIIVIVEMTDFRLGDPSTFSALNAALILAITTVVATHTGRVGRSELLARRPGPETTKARHAKADVPAADRPLLDRLEAFMSGGGYRQTRLGIKQLAAELAVPEHRLRRLINQGLGFRNFSSYLNAQRIPEARRRLRDPALADTPVLTIALDIGYGSIGPFNRAFKAIVGSTPTEYRQSGES